MRSKIREGKKEREKEGEREGRRKRRGIGEESVHRVTLQVTTS